MTSQEVDVARLVELLRARGLTIAVAESLTGGLVMATLTSVPGVSDVLRGGVVVYATDTKASEVGVNSTLLVERGPVDADVALEMARGVRRRWGADLGLATTGVAGPDPQDGHPVGEVYVAVSSQDDERVAPTTRPEPGPATVGTANQDRQAIRLAAVDQALQLLQGLVLGQSLGQS